MKSRNVILICLFSLLNIVSALAQIHSIGLRTSLPSWLLTSPSLGVDVQMGNRLSVGVNGSFAGCKIYGFDEAYRIGSLGVEGRRFFKGEAEFQGFYLGVQGRWIHANLRNKEPYRHGNMYTAGMLGGYTFVNQRHFGVDVNVGIGYKHSKYDNYVWYYPDDIPLYRNQTVENKFGLIQADVTLVYRFNLK